MLSLISCQVRRQAFGQAAWMRAAPASSPLPDALAEEQERAEKLVRKRTRWASRKGLVVEPSWALALVGDAAQERPVSAMCPSHCNQFSTGPVRLPQPKRPRLKMRQGNRGRGSPSGLCASPAKGGLVTAIVSERRRAKGESGGQLSSSLPFHHHHQRAWSPCS